MPGEAEAALHRLHAKLDAPSGARRPSGAVLAALEDVRTVTAHLRAWGLPGAQVTNWEQAAQPDMCRTKGRNVRPPQQ